MGSLNMVTVMFPIVVIVFVLFLYGINVMIKRNIKNEINLYFLYTICVVVVWSIYNIFIMGPMSPVQFLPTGFVIVFISPVLIPIILILNFIFIKNSDCTNKGLRFAINILYTIIWLIIMVILISIIAPVTDYFANVIAR